FAFKELGKSLKSPRTREVNHLNRLDYTQPREVIDRHAKELHYPLVVFFIGVNHNKQDLLGSHMCHMEVQREEEEEMRLDFSTKDFLGRLMIKLHNQGKRIGLNPCDKLGLLQLPIENLSVGYPLTPYSSASFDSWVASTLASLISDDISTSFSAALAYSGARALQCPHHGASVSNVWPPILTEFHKHVVIGIYTLLEIILSENQDSILLHDLLLSICQEEEGREEGKHQNFHLHERLPGIQSKWPSVVPPCRNLSDLKPYVYTEWVSSTKACGKANPNPKDAHLQ
ncbi:unnamed protein product, partial [Darwinula stevensoni]